MGTYLIIRFWNFIRNPRYIVAKIQSVIRHWRYPECSSKAILYKPLLITPRFLKLGDNVNIFTGALIQGIDRYASIDYNPLISIGQGTSIRQNSHITCASSVTIGQNCAITHNVTITDIDHSFEYSPSNYPPPIGNKLIINNIQIGDNCMIFPNCVILGGSIIGNNCVIGANSVVRGIFPDNSVIVGSPARIVKRYNPKSEKWDRTSPDGTFKK